MQSRYSISIQGWVSPSTCIPSPNYDSRTQDTIINCIIIHAISLPPKNTETKWVIDFFTNQLDPSKHPYFETMHHLKVSSHFLIDPAGNLFQFVSTNDRAWHAGESALDGDPNCNNYSIGIELIGNDEEPFKPFQYETLTQLAITLRKFYPSITKERIVGHCHVAPNRKTDPGPFFDWAFLNKM
ncbi:MAG: 1,6-anhydro-N-acetylmuramyl-L-alanine amidase AmpD [Methylacidiphilales bacterium]|nr:1,6-anhydro-N-acetylmuramyl-L-alanine amidase AmpD [Candidatus Methylacidiphilales bacterium]